METKNVPQVIKAEVKLLTMQVELLLQCEEKPSSTGVNDVGRSVDRRVAGKLGYPFLSYLFLQIIEETDYIKTLLCTQ